MKMATTMNRKRKSLTSIVERKASPRGSRITSLDELPTTLDKSLPIVDRCFPQKVSDVAVQKVKIQELKTWLEDNKSSHGRLLLTGPSGCGKSSAVICVAKSLGVNVVQFENNLLYREDRDGGVYHEHEMDAFHDFLKNTRKAVNDNQPVILLIDSLSQHCFSNVASFQRTLSESLAICRLPVIFCLSESGNFLTSYNVIFTSNFKISNDIIDLSFNKIAAGLMKTAIQRVLSITGIALSTSAIANIIDVCDGDIRSACNSIQFCQKSVNSMVPALKGCFSSNLFHQIGSLLYANRLEDTASQPSQKMTQSSRIQDAPLKRDPDEILGMCNTSPETITSFIHDHEPNFAASIHETRMVFEEISVSDVFFGKWEDRKVLSQYGAQICARSVQYWNSEKKKTSRRYMISKPEYRNVEKEIDKNNGLLKSCVHTVFLSADFNTLLLPLLPSLRAVVDKTQAPITSFLSRPLTLNRKVSMDVWLQKRATLSRYRVPVGKFVLESTTTTCLPLPDTIVENVDVDEDGNGQMEQDKIEIDFSDEEQTDDLFDSFDEDDGMVVDQS